MADKTIDTDALLKVAQTSYKPIPTRLIDDEAAAKNAHTFVAAMSEKGYKFNRASINAVVAYAKGYNLLIAGAVGLGKTLFFKLVNNGIYILPMSRLALMKYEDLEAYMQHAKDHELLIDDVGTGTGGNNYGTQYDALYNALLCREKSRYRTHFTTNCSSKELLRMYDPRVVDRILSTSHIINFGAGNTNRTPLTR